MIRKFQQHDIEQALKVWLDASILAHDFISKDFWESKIDDMRNIYFPMAETYVFDSNGKILGFISLIENTITAIFVSPDSQGQGIGKQLINKAKQLRIELKLNVYKDNTESIAFYKKCEFKVVKENIDKHTGFPELIMFYTPKPELIL